MSDLLNGTEDGDKNAIESETAQESVASAAAANAPEEKPATPDKPEASNEALVEDLTKKAHDLDAVRKSVEDAASISGTLWFSYLFTLLYIAIAAGAVTHNDLLLENPVKLPFLNVELPLVAFFALAPILFIIAHAYTLMHFLMLAAKVGTYDTELREKLSGKEADTTRLGLRRQLPSNIFVQFLAGPSDIREGGLGWLLKAVAWISLVMGPVLLLLLLQIQFLPYHGAWVTWVQRFAVLADLTLLWFLWPAVLASRSAIRWPRLWRYPVLTIVSLAPIGVAFVAARFPGKSLNALYGAKKWIPSNVVTAWLGAVNDEGESIPTSLHDLLFNGPVNNITLRRKSLFSNTLVLPNFDGLNSKGIDDQKKLDWAKHSLVLRGRHLEGAVFTRADLRKADLEGAQLQGTSLKWAQLQGASLDFAQLQGASLNWAQLQGASLNGRGFRARGSAARSFRARRSTGRSFRARGSAARSFRARGSAARSFRARRSTGRSFRARGSVPRAFRARRSISRALREQILTVPPSSRQVCQVRASGAQISRMRKSIKFSWASACTKPPC